MVEFVNNTYLNDEISAQLQMIMMNDNQVMLTDFLKV